MPTSVHNSYPNEIVILLVRHELPLTRHDRRGLFRNFGVDITNTNQGGIYYDDTQALEALHLVAPALGETFTVRVVGGELLPPA